MYHKDILGMIRFSTILIPMPEISPYIQSLIGHAGIVERQKRVVTGVETEESSDLHPMTQKAASWYEKVRNAIDYGEGDQIRRRAVERLLKRRIIFEKDEHIGESLLEDLVTAGYIDANLSNPENSTGVDFIVKKYTSVFVSIKESNHSDSLGAFKKWTRSMAAIEIYRMLFPDTLNRKTLEIWVSILKDSIKVDPLIDKERFQHSLYFAALRSLLEQSNPELHYSALEEAYPKFVALNTKDELYELPAMVESHSQRIYDLSKILDERIKDPLVWHIMKKIKNSRISIELVKEIIGAYGERARDVLSDKTKLDAEIRNNLASKYSKLSTIVRQNGKRALLYILITKIAIALAIEVPLDKLFFGSVNNFALAVNIILPPLLLLVMTRWSLGLDKANTEGIQKSVVHLTEGKNEKIVLPASAGTTSVSFGVAVFNGFFYVTTFSIIIGVLVALHFQFVSIILFMTFLALVCYFGTRVRGAASRWRYDVYKKDSLSLAARLLVFPIMRLGRWLTESFSTVNFFVFFMDMIIETPFRLVLAEFNSFMNFVKDRADDVM